jgi:hypothetical protein
VHIVAPGQLGAGFLAFGKTAQKIAALLRGQFRFRNPSKIFLSVKALTLLDQFLNNAA